MADVAYVTVLPSCDMCKQEGKDKPAEYDSKTFMGPWASMCRSHWERFGVGQLGTGRGQRYVVGEKPRETYRPDMTLDEIEDMVGDGDIAAFL